MIKKVISGLFTAFIIIASSISCAGGTANRNIIWEVFPQLEQMATAGIAEIDGDLEKIYQDLYDIDEKLLYLEQIMKPAQEWVEHQKSIEREPGDWLISVDKEDLKQFKNDHFKITKLDFTIINSRTENQQVSSEIKVQDLETGSTGTGKAIQSELVDKQKALERNAEKKLENRKLLASTMETLIAVGGNNWEIDKIDKSSYLIKADNLGWADKLTAGTWKYNIETKTLEPADVSSAALKKLLLASL